MVMCGNGSSERVLFAAGAACEKKRRYAVAKSIVQVMKLQCLSVVVFG
jgi:hypothetical protein